jgi:hypothetical protein
VADTAVALLVIVLVVALVVVLMLVVTVVLVLVAGLLVTLMLVAGLLVALALVDGLLVALACSGIASCPTVLYSTTLGIADYHVTTTKEDPGVKVPVKH